jgi:hypothetical protein
MAKIELNAAVGAIRGKMDGWVYRQHRGQTVVQPHRILEKGEPTAAQHTQRERFRAAQAYAAEVLANPLRRQEYQKLGVERKRPPNALLVANFLTPPVIEQVEFSGYAGGQGEPIWIVASDAIEVVDVTIAIRGADDVVIESGPAAKDHGVWVYRTTTTIPANAPRQIEVTARNRARTEAKRTVETR